MAKPKLIMPVMSEVYIKRFREKFIPANPDKCWPWIAWRDDDGYGGIKIRQRSYRAHRIAYFLYYGTDPQDKEVCHRCDYPPCVNPAHLFLGTTLDNIKDKIAKGRAATGTKNGRYTHPESTVRGERVSTAQLTESDVREILLALRNGSGLTELGRKYGVCKQAIYSIREGKTWKHVNRF